MSSSERSSSGESDDESLPDLQKLKPYDLEPEILSLDGISTSSDEEELSSSDCSLVNFAFFSPPFSLFERKNKK